MSATTIFANTAPRLSHRAVEHDCEDLTPDHTHCPWCTGGRTTDGRGVSCPCPDCGGTGWITMRGLTDDE